MADGMEFKRAKAPLEGDECLNYLSEADWPRPTEPAPSATALLVDREEWSSRFVPWYFSQTAGEIELPDIPAGQRWRIEYFECVADPEAFEKHAEQEIEAYRTKESGYVEGK